MDKINRFMPVHADAMAGTMRQPRSLIARAIALRFVKTPHGIIDTARRRAGLRRRHGDLLPPGHRIENAPHRIGRGARHEAARNIGLIAADCAATIDQHHFTGANPLRCR